jgi:hypothetical protein
MTTLNEMIQVIKAENPVLKTGNEDQGYEEIKGALYDEIIAQWAQGRLDKEAKLAQAKADELAKLEAMQKLITLGIDPKVFGLQAEQSTPIVIDEAETK